MSVRMTVLASGSRGNCTVISSDGGSILVDAGISCRETMKRLRSAGEDPHQIKAIVISHEHADHVAGLEVLARKLKVPVYMSEATYQSWRRSTRDAAGKPVSLERREHFRAGHRFIIGNITVMPFTIPHDAADPCGFTFKAGGVKVGIATDLGYLPFSVKDNLRNCDGLMIESNHDLEMLRNGPYPWMVKQRVMSRVGHLSNSALADFLQTDYDGNAKFLVLAHLSEQNNRPELAQMCADKALGTRLSLFQSSTLALARQDQPLQPIWVG